MPRRPKATDPLTDGPVPTKPSPPKRVQIRYEKPEVAEFVAKAIVKNNFDTEKAVKQISPSLSPVEVADEAQAAEKAAAVKAALERELETLGFDDASLKKFSKKLWKYALSDSLMDEKKTIAAWRILAHGFGLGEGKDEGKPDNLPIRDLNSGLRRMLGEGAPKADTIVLSPKGEA